MRCGERRRRYASALKRDAAALLKAVGLRDCELSVTLTSMMTSIRALNREYRKKDRPTDVLSFSQIEEPGARRPILAPSQYLGMLLGDVVISIDTALAQARDYGVDLHASVCARC